MSGSNRVKFNQGSYKGLYGTVVGYTCLEPALIVRVDGYNDTVYCSIPQLESADEEPIEPTNMYKIPTIPIDEAGEELIDAMIKKRDKATVKLRIVPWPDYDGNNLYEGDRIRHPDGTEGTIVFVDKFESAGDQWRVDYDDSDVPARLCFQVDYKGRAVKIVQ